MIFWISSNLSFGQLWLPPLNPPSFLIKKPVKNINCTVNQIKYLILFDINTYFLKLKAPLMYEKYLKNWYAFVFGNTLIIHSRFLYTIITPLINYLFYLLPAFIYNCLFYDSVCLFIQVFKILGEFLLSLVFFMQIEFYCFSKFYYCCFVNTF